MAGYRFGVAGHEVTAKAFGTIVTRYPFLILERFGVREPKVSRVVLLVDDEPLVREITAAMLEDLGCAVKTAANAQDALKKLAADRRIEILITDINMPGMDGYDLAEAARRMRVGLSVIILSGRATEARGFPLIRKPFGADDLKRTMARHTGLC